MGKIIKISCPKCNLTKELYLGQGMFDYNLEKVLTYLPEEEALQINQMFLNKSIKSFEFKRYLSICPKCKRIEEAPVLALELQSRVKLQYGVTCSHCGANLNTFYNGYKMNDISCPYCGDANLEIHEAGYWD